MSRYRIEGPGAAGPDHTRVLAHDTVTDQPVELLGLKRHVWLRPDAAARFGVRAVPAPAGIEPLGRTEHDGQPVVVLPRARATLRGVRLTPDEARATLRWLAPALVGSPFRGRLTVDDIWIGADGHPRLFGLDYPEEVRLHPPAVEPPEAARGEVAPTSDLYSLGAILYAAVCGQDPGRPAVPLQQRCAVPDDVAEAIRALLAEDPAQRVAPEGGGEPPVLPAAAPLPTAPSLPVQRERWAAAVTVDLAALSPVLRARLAVLAGATPEALARTQARALPFVVGAYADAAEARAVAGRIGLRGIAAQVADTRTPPIVQWVGTAFLAAALGVASSGNVRYGFVGMALLLGGVAFSRLRRGLDGARLGLAIVERLQAGYAEDASGQAAATRAALRRANVAEPIRTDALEALDAAVDRLADLAAAALAHPADVGAAERRAAEADALAAVTRAREAMAHAERG